MASASRLRSRRRAFERAPPVGAWAAALSGALLACGGGEGGVPGAVGSGAGGATSSTALASTGAGGAVGVATVSSAVSTGSGSGGAGGAGGEASPLTVMVLSDLNGSYGSTTYQASVHSAVAQVVSRKPDLVLSTGDMVAGQQAGLDYAAMWAALHEAVTEPLAAANIPLAVTPGNHDASGYPAFAGERAIYAAQWEARKPDLEYVDDAGYPFHYAFVVGGVLFISLDATTIGPLGATQRQWLTGVLDDTASYRATIVFGHVPLYGFAEGRADEILDDPALEALLAERGVTAFISGHHHAYYPGRRASLRLVSMACLGSGPRALLGQSSPSARSVLWLRIDGGGITELDAYGGASFDAPIHRSSLPASVGARVIVRDDL